MGIPVIRVFYYSCLIVNEYFLFLVWVVRCVQMHYYCLGLCFIADNVVENKGKWRVWSWFVFGLGLCLVAEKTVERKGKLDGN